MPFNEKKLRSYWFGSGTPTYLIEMSRKFQVIPQELGGCKCKASDFDVPTERITNITPLFYQNPAGLFCGRGSVYADRPSGCGDFVGYPS